MAQVHGIDSMRTDQEYINFDPCAGDRDVNIEIQDVRIVKCRARHHCYGSYFGECKEHFIEVGERARYEHAFVDGHWGSFHVCLPCIDKYLDQWE